MTLPRAVLWRREDLPHGLELVRLLPVPQGYLGQGCLVALEEGVPWSCRYSVVADHDWATREVGLEAISPEATRTLVLKADGAGGWEADGAPVPELEGALDVDLGGAVFTNTLPVRRLGLDPQESRDIRVAWVDLPALTVEVVQQRYAFLEKESRFGRYEYRSLPSGPSYVLTVDDEGLVVNYDRLARRIGAW